MVNEGPVSPLQWRRSTKCDVDICVEVADEPEGVYVRGSREPTLKLKLTHDQWRGFVAGVVSGAFDR
jgi:hypothetical protein